MIKENMKAKLINSIKDMALVSQNIKMAQFMKVYGITIKNKGLEFNTISKMRNSSQVIGMRI